MKTLSILGVLLFLFSTCTPSDGLGGVDDVYIPDFSNQWTVLKGQPSGFYFFTASAIDSAKGTGVLSGQCETGAIDLLMAGTFHSLKVTLTISADSLFPGTPPLSDSSFTGVLDTIAKPAVLRLTNTVAPYDSLVLLHG